MKTNFEALFELPQKELVSIKEAAGFLGCSVPTLRKILKTHGIKTIQLSGATNSKMRIVVGELQSYVQRQILGGK